MRMTIRTPFIRLGHGIFLAVALSTSNPAAGSTSDYAPLVDLFGEFVEWRTEVSRSNLALDPERYDEAAVTARVARLRGMRRRFDALETSGWSVPRRVEGWATYLEEVPLQLGFYDDKPRVGELIYNFGIFRAVRTIGDVKLQRNQTNPERVAGRIPISLLRWEMTGLDDEIERLWTREPLDGSIESIR